MKVLLVLIGLTFSMQVSAKHILDRCRDAALATGYVYENILSATVDTKKMDKEDQEIFWTLLTDDVFTIVKHYPKSYELGNYFPANSHLKFTFKLLRERDYSTDARLEDKQRNLIHYMSEVSGVKIDCAYAL
ncbi:putative exported protein [Halobacteriovorax marinus SJ]|uniref:Exported protein n=1 Tax=Halobacteriovorax marinus (strain ATCC BAA-682 / DSM 15412 / SJ) TaxID=862908 RepID=E1X0C3_HALMS|nr:hypothetical protein [Halobacteriovorax marinus]CBW26351.1 putative exported protein [Halobacteriovorax marinus SJ]